MFSASIIENCYSLIENNNFNSIDDIFRVKLIRFRKQ